MKHLRITVEGKTYEVEVELLDEQSENSSHVSSESSASVSDSTLSTPKTNAKDGNIITSPLSAVVVSVDVSVGDKVEEGQKVITLEAMKMNTVVTASVAGVIEEILVSEGNSVEEGQALIKFG